MVLPLRILIGLSTAVLMLVGLGLHATPAQAQSAVVDDRYPHLFAPRQQPAARVIPVQPRQGRAQQRTAVRRVAPDAIRPPRATPPSTPDAAALPPGQTPGPAADPGPVEVEPTTFVLVIGDNLSEWLAFGLENALEDIPEIGVVDETRISSGLVRAEFHDWVKSIPEIIAAQPRVDFIVMMVGSNDRQPFRVDRDNVEFRSDRWREIYIQRVDAVMAAMKARGVPTFWVGLPALRGPRLSADMAYFNDIYKERAAANGVTFIDVWNGFIDEQGQYTQFGPDHQGQQRRLRTADGVHFTQAGARKLAFFAEQELRRALPGRINPQAPRPGGADPQPADPELGIPLPEAARPDLEASGLTPPRPRPLAGPVITLTGGEVTGPAPGTPPSPLAGGGTGPRMIPAAPARSEPPSPQPGRTDDFRWTRPMPGPR